MTGIIGRSFGVEGPEGGWKTRYITKSETTNEESRGAGNL